MWWKLILREWLFLVFIDFEKEGQLRSWWWTCVGGTTRAVLPLLPGGTHCFFKSCSLWMGSSACSLFVWGHPQSTGLRCQRKEIGGGRTDRKLGRECWKGGTHRLKSAHRIHLNPGLTTKPHTHRRVPEVSSKKCRSWKLDLAAISAAAHCREGRVWSLSATNRGNCQNKYYSSEEIVGSESL